ncbi:hypothetical protein [Sharpea azabuensis]|uniref:hypothetical protein n=1 Tax=Sharpea azabuensis TaxID=322505 RepID=UPI00156937E5|nr:hypothetical protein [Sharpea azabuensis]
MKDNRKLTTNNEMREATDNLIATLNAIREKCESDISRLSVMIDKMDADDTGYVKETEYDAQALHAESDTINSYLKLLNELADIVTDRLGDAIKGIMEAMTAKLRHNAEVYDFNACMMDDGLRNADAECMSVGNTWKISQTLTGRIDGLYEVAGAISEAVSHIESGGTAADGNKSDQKAD